MEVFMGIVAILSVSVSVSVSFSVNAPLGEEALSPPALDPR